MSLLKIAALLLGLVLYSKNLWCQEVKKEQIEIPADKFNLRSNTRDNVIVFRDNANRLVLQQRKVDMLRRNQHISQHRTQQFNQRKAAQRIKMRQQRLRQDQIRRTRIRGR